MNVSSERKVMIQSLKLEHKTTKSKLEVMGKRITKRVVPHAKKHKEKRPSVKRLPQSPKSPRERIRCYRAESLPILNLIRDRCRTEYDILMGVHRESHIKITPEFLEQFTYTCSNPFFKTREFHDALLLFKKYGYKRLYEDETDEFERINGIFRDDKDWAVF